MFDVNLFSQMGKQVPNVYFNDGLDISALKLLYDNCIRMGSDNNNSNVSIAIAHPDLWFGDYFDLFKTKIKMVVSAPVFQLIRIEGNQLILDSHVCETFELKTDEDLKKFFEDMTEFGSIAVFTIIKYVDISTFNITWKIRYKDISTKEEIRDKKIDSII